MVVLPTHTSDTAAPVGSLILAIGGNDGHPPMAPQSGSARGSEHTRPSMSNTIHLVFSNSFTFSRNARFIIPTDSRFWLSQQCVCEERWCGREGQDARQDVVGRKTTTKWEESTARFAVTVRSDECGCGDVHCLR